MTHALGQANPLQQRLGPLLRLGPVGVGHACRQQHVLQRVELRQQMVALENKTDLVVAPLGQARRRHRGERLAAGEYFAAGRFVESAQQMQQCAFAGTGRALQREKFALSDLETHPVQHLDQPPAEVVRLVQILRAENRFTHDEMPPQAEVGWRSMQATLRPTGKLKTSPRRS